MIQVKHCKFYNREEVYKLFFALEPLDENIRGEIRALFDTDTAEIRIKLNMFDPEKCEGPSRITLHDSVDDDDEDYFYCLYFESLSHQVDYELIYQKLLDHEWSKGA